MPAGEVFGQRQRGEIERAVRLAARTASLDVAVHVGPLVGDPRSAARSLHAQLGARAAGAVLVALDPAARCLEIVTGPLAARRLDDEVCSLVALSMTTSFAAGDLAGGLAVGVQMLADHAREPRTLHLGD